jgi:hypothetical protein
MILTSSCGYFFQVRRSAATLSRALVVEALQLSCNSREEGKCDHDASNDATEAGIAPLNEIPVDPLIAKEALL